MTAMMTVVTVDPFRLTPNLSTQADPLNMGETVRLFQQRTVRRTKLKMRLNGLWPAYGWKRVVHYSGPILAGLQIEVTTKRIDKTTIR